MRTAVEKRGVAVLVIPGDVFLAEAMDGRVTRSCAAAGRAARRRLAQPRR